MRSNRKIIFGLLLILGAFGFYRAYVMLSAPPTPRVANNSNAAAGDPNVQPVSVKTVSGRIAEARINIPANTIVTPDMLRMVPYQGPSTQGFITDIESQGAGFITSVDIPAKAQIRPQYDFVGHVSETGIAGLLRPGTRAMVIPMANKPTLHDLVRIGNYVDIIAAFDGQESRTLIQNVRVLGVDLSANDYPNVNVAMRGPSKAAPQSGPANPAAGPTPTPTPAPNNAPRPEPALTLEVTPRQASALQLAMSSNATLDYLVRPALPGNRTNEIVPLPGDANNPNGEGTLQTVAVTKRQIAPYASSVKAAGGTGARNASTGGGNTPPRSGKERPIEYIGGGTPPEFPSSTPGTSTVTPVTVPNLPPVGDVKPSKPAPTPTQVYNIPIYGDGRVVRTETVPLPSSSR